VCLLQRMEKIRKKTIRQPITIKYGSYMLTFIIKKFYRENMVDNVSFHKKKSYRAKTNFAQHILVAEQKSLSDKKRFHPFYAAMELSCCLCTNNHRIIHLQYFKFPWKFQLKSRRSTLPTRIPYSSLATPNKCL